MSVQAIKRSAVRQINVYAARYGTALNDSTGKGEVAFLFSAAVVTGKAAGGSKQPVDLFHKLPRYPCDKCGILLIRA